MNVKSELLLREKLTKFEFALLEVQIENAENKIRSEHNKFCKTGDCMSYQSKKFLSFISLIPNTIKE